MNTLKLNQFLLRGIISSGMLRGGLKDGYNSKADKYSFVYCETTGYLLNHLCNLYSDTKDPKFIKQIVASADFLLSTLKNGKIPNTFEIGSRTSNNKYYTFDNAICVSGLVDAFHATGNTIYLSTAKTIARWVKKMMKAGLLAYWDEDKKIQKHPGKDFSLDKSVIQLKNIIGLAKVEQTKQFPNYSYIVKVLRSGEKMQNKSGGFVVNKQNKTVFSHAHCYATEAYLMAHILFEKKWLLKVAQNAGDYLVRSQHRDGGIFQNNSDGLRASDATAQAIRIWKTLDLLTGSNRYEKTIGRAMQFLSSMQSKHTGGLAYTAGTLGIKSSFQYNWVSMFVLSAYTVSQLDKASVREIY